MTPERLQTIETIFHSARELEPCLRSSFLDQACSTDADLRAEIEALLNAHESADGFIAKPAPQIAAEVLAKEQAALVVGRMFGHYRLLEPLGQGGMGEVYLAADNRSGRQAALKLLPLRFTGDAERFNRFQREARTVIALNHPNIVTIYEIGEDDSTHYIVSELIEGETLHQRLARGRMELSEALDIALQVARALAAAHRAGIVHRDIKPENIMLRPDGYVKVLDFGIAKLAEESEPAALTKKEVPLLLIETSAGRLLGTARYMSPEQARGLSVDERTDIWSLGVVLYEMVAGCTPFNGETPTDVITSILTAAPSTLTDFRPDVSAELQQIISKALRKDRQERYGSVDEMAEALKDLRRNLEADGQTKPAWRRWKVASLLLTLLVAALAVSLPLFWSRSKSQGRESEPSIAVLPFVNMSPDKENEYLGDGITEELCTALTQLKGLRVPARTSSFAFKGKTEDVRKIGEQLNVGTVLEGSVSKAGNKLRVSAQLINVANGFHLWAANYDREMTDILEIRSDISRRVVDALKIQLGVSETERLTKKPTEMTEAYNSYLLGRYELNKFTEAGFTNAVAHFKRAIALDPSFAIATAGLAEAYNMLGYWNYLPPKEAFPEAKKAAEQALELDPALAEAHTALAYSRFQYEWKFEEAEMEFKEAIRLNPGSVDARLGFCEYLFDLGRAQDAHEQLERAKELDPLSVRVSFCFAAESFFERDFDRAAERLQTTISMDPNNAFAYDLLEAVLWRQNAPAEAFEASEKTNALEGIFSQQEMADMRKAYEVSGYSGYLRKENELRQQHLAQGKYESPLIIALTYARAGANSEALDWLEKAAEERTPWLPELKIDPAWDGVRSDPRFIAVLKKIGLESKPSIAVLPFENLSEEKSNAYFADGIQGEILIRLSKIADLKVISRTSTQKYKSAPPNLREIARQLGVSNILEGSVQKATDQVRISVQLINALNDSHLWAETYARKLIDMFQVESDVAQKIAGALEAKLTGKEKAAINSRGTDNPQAYEAYLHAVALRTSQSTEEQQRYVDFCRQAVELDPNYAQAWADLAVAEANKYFFPEHTMAQKERARVAAENALRLAPDLADAQAAMGLYYYCLRDYERALAKLEGARQLAPNDWKVISSIALIKRRQGKMEEAIALLKEAAQLDPLNEDVWVKLAGSYAGIRKFDEARSTFDRALKIVPNNAEILSQKAGSYLAAGDLATAWRIMKDLKVSTNNRSFGTYIAILVFQRRFDDAIAFVSSAIEQGKEVSPTFLAIAHAELGQLNLVKGRQAQAQPLFVQAESELKQLQGRDEEILVSDTLMTVEAHLGRHDEVERLAEANLQLLRQDQWQLPFEEETIARAYMILGDVDRALPLLSHALEVPCVLPLTPALLRLDPLWDPLRKDPRFQKLISGPEPKTIYK